MHMTQNLPLMGGGSLWEERERHSWMGKQHVERQDGKCRIWGAIKQVSVIRALSVKWHVSGDVEMSTGPVKPWQLLHVIHQGCSPITVALCEVHWKARGI